jgi:hypothetical protein
MTPSMKFEQKLSRSSDATVLRGKFLATATIGATPSISLVLNPNNFGPRAAALAAIFTRFRFKSIGFKFICTSGTFVSSDGAIGVLDDSSGTEGDAPTTINSVLEMRCSALNLTAETVPTEFRWEPVDKTLWYATYPGATGSDARLVNAGVVYQSATATGVIMSIEMDYELVFKGATDIGAL